jgi:hypothetical protein
MDFVRCPEQKLHLYAVLGTSSLYGETKQVCGEIHEFTISITIQYRMLGS